MSNLQTYEFQPGWLAIVVSTLIAVLILYGLVGWLIAQYFLNSDHHAIPLIETPGNRGLVSEVFRFANAKERQIVGWIIRPEVPLADLNPCVLMIHGFDSGKDKVWTFPDDPAYRGSMLDQGAESLAQAGFHVAAIDLRGHGESDDHGHVSLGFCEAWDVLDTIEYLIEHSQRFGIDPQRIGVRGESMGGATAMIAAAKDEHGWIQSLWIDSVYADARAAVGDFIRQAGVPRIFAPVVRLFLEQMTSMSVARSSPLDYIASVNCPVFLAHSTGDTVIPIRHFERLRLETAWRSPPQFWQLEGYDHNRLWCDPEYHTRQIEFFRQTLLSRPSNEAGLI